MKLSVLSLLVALCAAQTLCYVLDVPAAPDVVLGPVDEASSTEAAPLEGGEEAHAQSEQLVVTGAWPTKVLPLPRILSRVAGRRVYSSSRSLCPPGQLPDRLGICRDIW
ncbi:uncharacterized protein LOC126301376 [Schistocerca gregaria]|uniref:uncharacterized protein LOC126301376 n=1 Tax=Schistocerca gregaria TaxID=7010 RepID=UPI00211E0B82|nr:uncharacterized protein LOC126301376 [Schistocerca gregaria]